MKLLIVATWFPSPDSPLNGIFIEQQARALSRFHDVTVLAPVYSGDVKQVAMKPEDRQGLQVLRALIPTGRAALVRGYAAAVANVTRSMGADVVHAHVTNPGGAAAAIAKFVTRRPLVITEHRGPFSACMTTARDRTLMKTALWLADAVVAVSTSLRDTMRTYGITRNIDVVPNVVDTDLFRFIERRSPEARPFRVLFVGRLNDEQKNLPSLIRSIASLQHKTTYTLTVVGDGKYRPIYQALSRELGIGSLCEFIPHLSPAALNEQFQSHNVFVLPSLGETFGCVLAEAIAAGCPVVATDCGGPRDIVNQDTGLLVPMNDDAALQASIEAVCNRREGWFGADLAKYAETKFGAEAVVAQLDAIYRRIVKG
jgi:glycosyltransferase involved in cell wall biosynthesis